MTNFSPLRYPGGKGKLASYLTALLELNGLEGTHYAEPFAGGAAVALDLLFSERVRHIHINDLDRCVYAFWHSAVHHTSDLIALIRDTEVNVDSWHQCKKVWQNHERHDLLEVGFATFFLNRTNRSGILNGGIIGGLDQAGDWKIGCRFNKDELITRIKRIGFYRSRISVQNLDATAFLTTYLADVPESFLYIDPPYYVKGAYLYQNHFRHADHVRLAEIIGQIARHRWVVSYDNVEQIRRIYAGHKQEQFDITYSARSYARGTEVMVFSPQLLRPAFIYCSQVQKRRLAAQFA